MNEIADLIAKNKASDQADDERRYGKIDADPEAELEASLARQCPWCRFVYSTTKGVNARRTIWIAQAQHYGHLRCYQAFKESQQ